MSYEDDTDRLMARAERAAMTAYDDAQAVAQSALRAADVNTLLTKAYQLTHRLHALEAKTTDWRVTNAPEQSEIDDVRAQRDLITAEIERRCAEKST